ncbi:MAG: AAA family ATPase [Chloroflexi bacterium]|nr:AAA family ATPase [Chloroflexota bacterium]
MSESQHNPIPPITPDGREFVGRSQEMDLLRSALAEAKDGRGQVVMLTGEPGIGKTRTAQELARHAEAQGARLLWGWCYEGEGAPPYWPWVVPIQSYVRHTAPDSLRAQLGPGMADIAGLVPEIAEKLGDVPPPTPVAPEQARFRLFDAVTSFLKRAAADEPILLVLDDIHWADEPSLLLLQFLARQIDDSRLMIVLTSREAEAAGSPAVTETLAQLSRLPAFRRHVLSGLAIGDVRRFFQVEAGQDPDADLVQSLHAHTEGNPFFLAEVIRLMASQGGTGEDGAGALGLPQGVRDVIGQRLRRLSDQCNTALTTASVVGREFDFRMLGIVMEDVSETELLALVDEALEAHLIEEAPGQGDRYVFPHALVQQTLLESLSSSRKVRLHARIGEVLETLYGGQPENHAAELAHHFSEAAPVLGTDKMVRYALMAGEKALAAFAHEEAMGYFTQGLEAKKITVDDDSPALDAETAALLFGAGQAQASTLRRGAAHNLTRAFDYYSGVGDAVKAVEVAEFPMAPGVGRLRVTGLISRALELLPPDSLEAARLLSRYGWALGQEVGDYDKAMAALNQALAIAQEQGDQVLEMSTRANSAEVNFFNLRHQEVLDDGPKMRELGRQVENPQAEVAYRISAIMAAYALGQKEDFDRLLDSSVELAAETRDQTLLTGTLFVNSALAFTKGQWSLVRDLTDRGLAAMPAYPPLLLTRAMCEYECGDRVLGGEYLGRLLETARRSRQGTGLEFASVAQGIPLIAEITGSMEHLEAAARASNALLSFPSATPFLTQLARSGLALNMLLTGNISGIQDYYEALKPHRGQWLAWASVDQVLGQICRATGLLDRAVEHFESAMDVSRKSGYRAYLPRLGLLYSGTLLERRGDGDQEHAQTLIDEALVTAGELGMRPMLEQLTQLQDEIPATGRAAASNPAGLTQREADVIRLIAQGKTDREIAEELIIAIRTVTTHVGNILNKTGAANRAEAASFATRHGLD